MPGLIRTYNPVSRRYEAPTRKPAQGTISAQQLTGLLKQANAKLTAIGKCTNMQQVQAILG